jgi:hypothetical protein
MKLSDFKVGMRFRTASGFTYEVIAHHPTDYHRSVKLKLIGKVYQIGQDYSPFIGSEACWSLKEFKAERFEEVKP